MAPRPRPQMNAPAQSRAAASLRRGAEPPEPPELVVDELLADLLRRVHDEGSVARHRLVERPPGGEQYAPGARGRRDDHAVAWPEHGDAAARHARRRVADGDFALERVEEDAVARR